MEQCKCHHSSQGCELLNPTAININLVLKNINKLDFSPLFMVLYQNKEARKKSQNCYTGFASCFVQNAFFFFCVCARMQFKGRFWQSIMVVELTHMVQQVSSFSLVLLKFWSSLEKGKNERRDKDNSWIGIDSWQWRHPGVFMPVWMRHWSLCLWSTMPHVNFHPGYYHFSEIWQMFFPVTS